MNYLESHLKVVGTRPIRPDGVDKVTGRALFAADTHAAGMLWGRIKRSPHAHARIVSIDTSKAQALSGVMAVLTAADLPNIRSEEAFVGEGPMNFRDLSRNHSARMSKQLVFLRIAAFRAGGFDHGVLRGSVVFAST